MDIKTLTASSTEQLAKEINHYISLGYERDGNMQVSKSQYKTMETPYYIHGMNLGSQEPYEVTHTTTEYIQVMIKK